MAALIWFKLIIQRFDQKDVAALDKLLDAAPQALAFRFASEPKTMLHSAMAAKRLDLLDYLLARRPNPVLRELEELPPLHEACASPTTIDSVTKLLDEAADVNLKDPFEQTPLHIAACYHNLDALRLLLARGANVRARDRTGATVLDTAFERSFHADEGHKTLALLRDAGHPPTVLFAAATGDLELLQEFARDDHQALDRVYTRTGVRPLHAAVMAGQPRIIEWLFEQGVEPEAFLRPSWNVSHKETPLMRALSYDLTDIALLLIKNAADVNRNGSAGYYPVHAVIEWDRDPRILGALLAHGADPTLKYRGQTAVDFAKASKSEHREQYLELLDAAMPKSAAGR